MENIELIVSVVCNIILVFIAYFSYQQGVKEGKRQSQVAILRDNSGYMNQAGGNININKSNDIIEGRCYIPMENDINMLDDEKFGTYIINTKGGLYKISVSSENKIILDSDYEFNTKQDALEYIRNKGYMI